MKDLTTTEMTRNEALKEIAIHLQEATNDQVAAILFALLGEKWRSVFSVVDDE